MNKKKLVLYLVVALLVLITATAFAETKKLRRIGLYTFVEVKGQVPTADVMKTLFDRYSEDIKTGFELAGYPELYQPFMDQLRTTEFKDEKIAVGDKLMWMMFKSNGQVKIAQDIEWAGQQPLDAFSIQVKKDWKIYDFVIPKPCGNIALRNIEDAPPPLAVCSLVVTPEKANLNDPITIDMSGCQQAKSMVVEVFDAQGNKVASQNLTPDSPKWQTKFDKPGEYVFKASALNLRDIISDNPCQAKTYINFPPVCKLWTTCLPCEDYVGRSIAFDASGSTDPDGEIIKAVFEITDATGAVIDTFTKTDKPLLWEKIFQKEGVYTISATVFDNASAVSPASDACRLSFEVTQKRFFWMFEAGPLIARGTYTAYGFVRGGLFYWLTPNRLSLVASAGGAVPTQGDPWKFMFLANLLANVHAGPAFFGAGLGYSSKEQVTRKSGVDWVTNIGVDVFNKWTSMGSIFFEFRGPLGGSGRGDHPADRADCPAW